MFSRTRDERDDPRPSIVTERHAGVTVLGLVGEYDGARAGQLRDAIAVDCALDRGVVVSLAETDFIDSSIVLELFVGERKLQAGGRRLVVHTNPTMPCDRILAVARSGDAFLCCEGIEEAVDMASRRQGMSPVAASAC
jgi:anti-anti-sigma regulatory factor